MGAPSRGPAARCRQQDGALHGRGSARWAARRGGLCHAWRQRLSSTPLLWQDEDAAALKKKRTFRKFTFRGVDLDALLDLTSEQLMELVHARARRRFSRGLKKKGMSLVKKLRKAKKECGAYDKPDTVKTHLRNMIIVPEMIGSVVGVHNGKVFTSVEVKADMVGHYLAEFSISYKPVRHGRPGIGATSSSKFIPLK